MKLDDKDTLVFGNAVKDRMLRAMGYTQPELLKVEASEHAAYNMAFSLDRGVLYVYNLSACSKEQKIAFIRHELDHFDKAAKLYKAVGSKEFTIALQRRYPVLDVSLNESFWSRISRDADIENFDVARYLNAWKEPGIIPVQSLNEFNTIRNAHYYATEPLEESAYAVQKRVLQALGHNDYVLADTYGKPLGNIISRLDKMGISDEQKMKIYSELSDIAVFNESKDANLLIRNFRNIKAGTYSEEVGKAINSMSRYYDDEATYRIVKNMENWLSQGCYSVEDILAKGLV